MSKFCKGLVLGVLLSVILSLTVLLFVALASPTPGTEGEGEPLAEFEGMEQQEDYGVAEPWLYQ